MKRYLLTLLNLAISGAVLIGMPYLMGGWMWICFSWLPAIFVYSMLEEQIENMK